MGEVYFRNENYLSYLREQQKHVKALMSSMGSEDSPQFKSYLASWKQKESKVLQKVIAGSVVQKQIGTQAFWEKHVSGSLRTLS